MRIGRRMGSWLVLGAVLALGGCGMMGKSSEQSQQQAVERARKLCADLGYRVGTTEFAQCAQTEYDRGPRVAQPAPPPASAPQAQAAPPPATPPKADAGDDWFERWIHKPPCATCASLAH